MVARLVKYTAIARNRHMAKIQSKHRPCHSTKTHDCGILQLRNQFSPVTLAYGVLLLKLMLVLDEEGYRRYSGDHFIREARGAV